MRKRKASHLAAISSRLLLTILILSAIPPLRADMTITEHTSGQAGGRKGEGQRITSIKGSKIRIEAKGGNETSVTIYELEAGKKTTLKTKEKEAEVLDFTVQSANAERKVPAQSIQSTIKPTGQHKEILGKNCDEYEFNIRVPVFKDLDVTLVMTGTAYVVKEIPESKDYAEFADQAQKRGLILGLVSDNPAFIALARAQTEVFRLVGQLRGLALTTESNIKFEGGVGAGILNKTGSGQRTSDVTALNTDPIPDELFAIPPGWKVRTR
jgi:hypothetical protein